MRTLFKFLEQAPIIKKSNNSQGVYSIATYLNGPKENQQFSSEIIEDDNKGDIDFQDILSTLSINPSDFQYNLNAFEFNRTDFDFIKSDYVHICMLSEQEFQEGTIDLLNMSESVSVIVDDEDMLSYDDIQNL